MVKYDLIICHKASSISGSSCGREWPCTEMTWGLLYLLFNCCHVAMYVCLHSSSGPQSTVTALYLQIVYRQTCYIAAHSQSMRWLPMKWRVFVCKGKCDHAFNAARSAETELFPDPFIRPAAQFITGIVYVAHWWRGGNTGCMRQAGTGLTARTEVITEKEVERILTHGRGWLVAKLRKQRVLS